jgi:hypothetical protein
MRRVCSSLIGNTDGKKFQRPRYRLEDNTKIYLILLRSELLAGFTDNWQSTGTGGGLSRLHERRGIS